MQSVCVVFQLVFELITCTGKCKSGAASLDDIRILDGACADVMAPWPYSKSLKAIALLNINLMNPLEEMNP